MTFTSFAATAPHTDPTCTQIHRYPQGSLWTGGAGLCLDGDWRVALFDTPEAAPDFFAPGFDVSGWQSVGVPGNLEAQGLLAPIYTNYVYPFDPADPAVWRDPGVAGGWADRYAPPAIPAHNPAACYVRDFELPAEMSGQQVLLEALGIEGAWYVWCNGTAVGYDCDSKTPTRFDLTPHLRPGANRLCILCMRFSAATYVEDQDYWYCMGIYRPIRLVAKPAHRIEDWFITADANGHFAARCRVNQIEGYAANAVRVALYDGEQLIFEQTAAPATQAGAYWAGAKVPRFQPRAAQALIQADIAGIRQWTPDTPNLYTAVMTLLAPDGTPLDSETQRVGFRTIKITDNEIQLNGQRVVFRGVNRHECAWPTGRTVSEDWMRRELQLMKQLNFNAVRTSHYPDTPLWYDLCDEYGVLVVCEANFESHGLQSGISQDESWAAGVLDRAMTMALTHKNHPCIISWSLGNESGCGPGHGAMAGWLREFDPSRLVQYENSQPGPYVSDIRCPMYAGDGVIENMLGDPNDPRPIVQVEYCYQIANTTSGMERVRHLTENTVTYQGGFVWDWQDKVMPLQTSSGPVPAVGGDFGELTDPECPWFMCCNGVVFHDLTPKPSAMEIKAAQSPWWVEGDLGRMVIKNRTFGQNTDFLTAEYELWQDAKQIGQGPIALPVCAPGGEAAIQLPELPAVGEIWLTITLRQAHDTAYAKAGHEVYTCQTRREATVPPTFARTPKSFDLQVNADGTVACAAFTGGLPIVTRALTGIDYASTPDNRHPWAKFWPDNTPATCVDTVELITVGADHGHRVTGRITGGDVTISFTFDWLTTERGIELTQHFIVPPGAPDLPRLGVALTLPGRDASVEYIGMGPEENYPDRLMAARMGDWKTTAADMQHPFIPVAHHGTRTRVRRLRVGELAVQGQDFSFDIHPYRVEDTFGVYHARNLPDRDEMTLCIDAAMAGIGGDFAWSSVFGSEYRVGAGYYMTKVLFC